MADSVVNGSVVDSFVPDFPVSLRSRGSGKPPGILACSTRQTGVIIRLLPLGRALCRVM